MVFRASIMLFPKLQPCTSCVTAHGSCLHLHFSLGCSLRCLCLSTTALAH
ncbi:hypothetical protein LEMLEM_LOCUS7528 [Lemmus lemmus]